MPKKQSYGELGDACRVATALDLVGDRWNLIVVRELLLGPKRFAELEESVLGITPAVLADRLRFLQTAGIVERAGTAYATTAWGRGLEPVLQALAHWYSAGPPAETPPAGGMTPDAIVLAMRTMAPARPRGVGPVLLRLRDGRRPGGSQREYRVAASGGFVAEPGRPARPRATVDADSTVWSGVLFGGLPLEAAERDGAVAVTGERGEVERLIGLFG